MEVSIQSVPEGDLSKALLAATAVSSLLADSGEEPITLEQAKQHLRVYGVDDDAYITMLITAARQMAEGRLNRTIMPRELVATFDSWGHALRLFKPPVLSIEAITYIDTEGVEQTLTAGFLTNLMAEPARVVLDYGSAWPALQSRVGAVTVRYRAGYESGTVPYPIIQWMLLAIGTMFNNRETLINGVSSAALAGGFVDALLQPYMVYE